MTIRDMVAAIQVEMRDTDLQPERAAQLLAKSSALLGNCLAEIREADYHYAVLLLKTMETEKVANRAKVKAEVTPEFQRKQEARDTKELVLEMSRALKYVLRAAAEEMSLTR
jgi:hypothetical protein